MATPSSLSALSSPTSINASSGAGPPRVEGLAKQGGQGGERAVGRVPTRPQPRKPATKGIYSAPLRGCEEATMGSSPQTVISTPGGQGARALLALPHDREQLRHCTQEHPFSAVHAGQQRGGSSPANLRPWQASSPASGLCPWETSPSRT